MQGGPKALVAIDRVDAALLAALYEITGMRLPRMARTLRL